MPFDNIPDDNKHTGHSFQTNRFFNFNLIIRNKDRQHYETPTNVQDVKAHIYHSNGNLLNVMRLLAKTNNVHDAA